MNSQLIVQNGIVEKVNGDYLLTQSQVCDHLQISRTTLWRMRKSGEIRGIRDGRRVMYIEAELVAYLESRRAGPICS